MNKKLTVKLIEALKPADKRYEVRDTVTPGFYLRVSVKGRKTFYVNARVAKKNKRIKIGPYPLMSLAAAREKATDILRDVALGKHSTDTQEAPEPTLGEVIELHIKLYVKERLKDQRNRVRLLRKFEKLNDRKVSEIKRADIVCVLDKLIEEGQKAGVNRALAAIKKLFAWCVDRGILELNPIAGLKSPIPERSRERVLSDAELCLVYRAAEEEGYPFGPYLKLLALTAQRRGEVAGMRWSEIDFEENSWTIPGHRTKNSDLTVVPLSSEAVTILKALPRFANSDLVFTTNGKTPISGFGRSKRRLDANSGVTEWRVHDIRRTAATGMAKLGVQPHIIEAILNHKSGIVSGIAAVYNRHAYMDEKREAVRQWEKAIIQTVKDVRISEPSQIPGKR